MESSNIILLWKKEMKELFRDKKALITIFLPIILYPIIVAFISSASMLVQSNLDKKTSRILLKNKIPEKLEEIIENNNKVNIVKTDSINENELIKNEEVDIVINYIKNDVELYDVIYSSTIERSNRAYKRVQDILFEYREQLKEYNIENSQIDIPILDIVNLTENNLAKDSEMVGLVLGMILPFIITLYSMVGVVTMSADLTAGEKERGTLETIFSTPIKKIEIIIGKLFASMSVGIMSTLANLLALFPAVLFVMLKFPDFNITINPLIFVLCFFILIPIMIIVSSLIIGVGLFANSYREAQSYISPFIIIFMIPCYVAIIPELYFSKILALVPIANGVLVMRDAFMSRFDLVNITLTIFINLLVATITIIFMSRVFNSEKAIFGIKKAKGRRV